MATSHMADRIGRVLGGRYRLVAPLGAGASAQVYLAEDVVLRRRVAVKVLHTGLADDAAFLKRFRAEARSAAALSHPNILVVHDHGEDDDHAYLVTEHLGGGSLRAVLDASGTLTPAQALQVGLQAARGLAYAHARGLVHRDIKPANLLFGDDARLRIADFGLARALAEAGWTEPSGTVLGTARYVSPEQARGEVLDGRSDIYSLALVLVEAVTGDVPFAAETTVGTLMARQDALLPVPEELGALAPVLERAGRPDPEERFDAPGFVRALEQAEARLPPAEPLTLVRTAPPPAEGDIDLTDLPPTSQRKGDRHQVLERGRGADDTDDPPSFIADVGPRRARRRRKRMIRWALAALGAAALVAAAVAITLVIQSNQTPTYPTPDAVGDDLESVQRLANSYGWRLEEAPAREDGSVPGEILAQDPGPGVRLEEGDTFRVTVSQGQELYEVPDLGGLTVASATATLEEAGFVTGGQTTEPQEDVPAGVVLTWDGRDAELERGSTVNLHVSAGPLPRTVPDLVRRTYQQAADALTELGLAPTRADRFSDTVPAGQVIGTTPAPGELAAKGSPVEVRVSRGPELVEIPSMPGASLAEVRERLRQLGLQVQVEGDAFGVPRSTRPVAGTRVPRGTTVVIGLG